MTLERRLREQLDAAGAGLEEPADRLDRVVRRGRRRRALQHTTMGLAAVVVVLGAGAGLRAATTTRVAFGPSAGPSATATVTAAPASPAATATPAAPPTSTPDAAPTTEPRVPTIRVADLGAPVLAYNPGGRRLTLHRDGEEVLVWSGKIEAVTGDGADGVVVQADRRLIWIADVDAPEALTIVEADTAVTLRGMLPDGRVLYSTMQDAKDAEQSSELYFAVPLAAGAEPELVTTEGAYESWMVGPATTADGGMVMASCHMVCSLYTWPDEDDTAPFADPVYNGGGSADGPSAGIDAIDATPDGAVIALAEYVPAEGIAPPAVALLDGTSMKSLARIPLPLSKGSSWGSFTISVSADGQRVLVSMRPSATSEASGAVAVPRSVLLIEDALTDSPRTSRVDFPYGVLQWFDAGGP